MKVYFAQIGVLVSLIALSTGIGIGSTPPAFAQSSDEIRERKATLNALRPFVEKNLGQKVQFRVNALRIREGWAYIEAEPQHPDGTPIDYRNTPYAVEVGKGKGLVFALLLKKPGWKVIHWHFGSADTVLMEPLDRFRKAPYHVPEYVLSGTVGTAQKAITPSGTERKKILDALRIPVQKDLKNRPVVFKVDSLKVLNGWAFLNGKPLQPNGKPFDYHGTQYADAIANGMFDDGIVALLHQVNGRWTVVNFALGATDVPWKDWDHRYGAPRRIFPSWSQQ